MPTFVESLKKEIARVARKELREEIAALRKTLGLQRSEIAALKKHVQALQVQVKKLDKARAAPVLATSDKVGSDSGGKSKGKPGRKVTFTSERLKMQRARLDFTQEQMAKLLEVSSLSIWKWESGGAAPRAARIPHILQRLALGKRDARALVAYKSIDQGVHSARKRRPHSGASLTNHSPE